MLKRSPAPVTPGSRRFPFRDPDPKSRWGRYLQEIGTELGCSPEKKRQDLIESAAEIDKARIREAFASNGAHDVDGFFAPYIHAAVEHASIMFAVGLADLDKLAPPKGRGSPGNSDYYQIIAFWTWETERRLATEAGQEYRRAELCKVLLLHPDVLSRGVLAGGQRILRDLKAYVRPGASDLEQLGWIAAQTVRERVREVWPDFRSRAKAKA